MHREVWRLGRETAANRGVPSFTTTLMQAPKPETTGINKKASNTLVMTPLRKNIQLCTVTVRNQCNFKLSGKLSFPLQQDWSVMFGACASAKKNNWLETRLSAYLFIFFSKALIVIPPTPPPPQEEGRKDRKCVKCSLQFKSIIKTCQWPFVGTMCNA